MKSLEPAGVRHLRLLRRTLVSVAAIAGVLAAGSVHGQSPGLSDRDYVEIRQLAARYAHALDTGADQGRALANLFVDDGEVVRPEARGRNAIAAVVRRAEQGPEHVAHFALNHVIEPTRDGAAGWQYVVELRFDPSGGGGQRSRGSGGPPPDQRSLVGRRGGELVSTGRYQDVYVRTAEGWRFRRREFVPGPAPTVVPPAPSARHAPAADVRRTQETQPSVITASEGKVTGRQYLVVIDVGENGAPTTIYLGRLLRGHLHEDAAGMALSRTTLLRRTAGSVILSSGRDVV